MNTKNLTLENLNAQTAIPEKVKPWLIDDQSLTKKLKQLFADFSVNILSQTQAQANKDEARKRCAYIFKPQLQRG
jgi:chorismate-pyruvate lyase